MPSSRLPPPSCRRARRFSCAACSPRFSASAWSLPRWGSARWLQRPGPWCRRAACAEVVATILYLNALTRMPIADATAILQFTPLAITAGAALFLGAQVGWRRWLATMVGLIGVLIIVRPGGSGFNPYSLLALCGHRLRRYPRPADATGEQGGADAGDRRHLGRIGDACEPGLRAVRDVGDAKRWCHRHAGRAPASACSAATIGS